MSTAVVTKSDHLERAMLNIEERQSTFENADESNRRSSRGRNKWNFHLDNSVSAFGGLLEKLERKSARAYG
jgi:hypothetical protein